MAACKHCREAGDVVTFWKRHKEAHEGKGVGPTEEDWQEIERIHSLCPGRAFCFCQHKVVRFNTQSIPVEPGERD